MSPKSKPDTKTPVTTAVPEKGIAETDNATPIKLTPRVSLRKPLERVFEVDSQWFKEKLADQMISIRQLAKMMNLEPSAISLSIMGKRRLTITEATEIARHIVAPIDEVLRRAGMAVPAHQAAGQVEITGWADAEGVITLGKPMGSLYVDGPGSAPDLTCDAVRIQNRGNLNGWVLLFKDLSRVEGVSADAVGELCVVELAGGIRKVRFLSRGFEPGSWILESMFGGKLEEARIRAASPITCMRRA